MDPRIILRRLIERLEPEVGKLCSSGFESWEAEEAAAAEGTVHLLDALIEARAALASWNERRILEAALHLPPFERIGRDMSQKHRRRQDARELARSGGIARARKQAPKVAKRWAPYEKLFAQLADGKDRQGRLKARRLVTNQMTKDGFIERSTGMFPSRQTINRHFPTK